MGRYTCQEPGCREVGWFDYSSQRELHETLSSRYYREWRCTRHSNSERLLTPTSGAKQAVLVCSEGPADKRYWKRGDKLGSGLNISEAHYADANDFPVGTRLVITAYTETPDQAALTDVGEQT